MQGIAVEIPSSSAAAFTAASRATNRSQHRQPQPLHARSLDRDDNVNVVACGVAVPAQRIQHHVYTPALQPKKKCIT